MEQNRGPEDVPQADRLTDLEIEGLRIAELDDENSSSFGVHDWDIMRFIGRFAICSVGGIGGKSYFAPFLWLEWSLSTEEESWLQPG